MQSQTAAYPYTHCKNGFCTEGGGDVLPIPCPSATASKFIEERSTPGNLRSLVIDFRTRHQDAKDRAEAHHRLINHYESGLDTKYYF